MRWLPYSHLSFFVVIFSDNVYLYSAYNKGRSTDDLGMPETTLWSLHDLAESANCLSIPLDLLLFTNCVQTISGVLLLPTSRPQVLIKELPWGFRTFFFFFQRTRSAWEFISLTDGFEKINNPSEFQFRRTLGLRLTLQCSLVGLSYSYSHRILLTIKVAWLLLLPRSHFPASLPVLPGSTVE